ncbi:MAG: hypothetical protein KAH08_05240 [Methylococcales bacterium]|nr:hypothetical protein [Methylococcales bacterium]
MERLPVTRVFEYLIKTDHCTMENYPKLQASLLIMLKDLDDQLADIIQKPFIAKENRKLNIKEPKNIYSKKETTQ